MFGLRVWKKLGLPIVTVNLSWRTETQVYIYGWYMIRNHMIHGRCSNNGKSIP